jgi:hypothetical protein
MDSEVKPEIWLVAIEDTDFLSENARAQIGRLWGLYIVDASMHIHICSLTPSLALWHVGMVTGNEITEDLESLKADLLASYEIMDYWGRSVLNTPLKENVTAVHLADFPGYDDRGDYDEWINDIADHYRYNVHYPIELWKLLNS